ncbi:3-phosphoshikimate 1-carboxyvinyltransferase [Propionibacterium freudenreichii]|uniref:3-phosphoshikimate 1-carboxyvinyltransferase n=1 Tax=Propionibacterium freudenreichii TaxID=1744 RepID=UPI002434489A|nr:3-phosphoshikimate 1-carboxyvinyltransferase [Propionibacterium freudenreichii]WFF31763.1 3-phosphoshikimate 1-carboxyvinyltransferase [Propionibacterium freudenreichii]
MTEHVAGDRQTAADPRVTTSQGWPAPRARVPLHATVHVPGSKSEGNRALVLAALGDGPSTITGLPDARDIRLMIAALRGLGTTIAPGDAHEVTVHPGPLHAATAPIDCGLAGTVMRFVPPLAALVAGTTRFVGDDRAAERPIAPLLEGLRQLGAATSSDAIPFDITAPDELTGHEVSIDASASSQFISGLLLAAAAFPQGIDLMHTGANVPSAPHIDMTIAMLARHGVRVAQPERGRRWVVESGMIRAADERIEPDLTNAAVFLIAGVITGGSVAVADWPRRSTQPGALIGPVLARMGAAFATGAGRATATHRDDLQGAELDLRPASELTCSVAALAVAARGTTTIRGVGHIRGHETDRIAAIATELTRVGVDVAELPDGLRIEGMAGRLDQLHPSTGDGLFRCYADHRMAHLGALIGLMVPGIRLDDVGSTTKTMPDFPGEWDRLVNAR